MSPPIPEGLYVKHLNHVKAIYEQALEKAGADGILLHSGQLKTAFLDDRTYPFIVNPHFNYWLPLDRNNDCLVLFRPGNKPVLFYMQPDDYWHQVPEDLDAPWTSEWDVVPVSDLHDAHNRIGDSSQLIFVGEESDLTREWQVQKINPSILLDPIHYERALKTDYEMACIAEANRKAARGHVDAKMAFNEGLSEFEIHLRYLAAIGQREHETPYPSIIAINEHAAVLHYQHYESRHIPEGQRHTLLIDAGATWAGYASDVTRTHSSSAGMFRDLISVMDSEQQSLIESIQCGLEFEALNESMHHRLAGILKDADILNMSPADIVENGLTFYFCPHGLGHLLGLQTHDIGGHQQTAEGKIKGAPDKYPALRLTRPIEERQVFTIEPGLYFISSLLDKLHASRFSTAVNWELIETLKPHGGIRIEDNVTIVNGNTINFTRSAFKEQSAQ